MAVINTNVKALFSQAALKLTERSQQVSMQQLSTGKRINSSRDDAAGMAIATRMTQQIRSLNQAVRNAGDAITLIQTAEGATSEITDMMQRMRELAIQASNDTNNNEQRSYLDLEFQQLKKQIVQIANNTEWNGFPVLNGSTGERVGIRPVYKTTSEPAVTTALSVIAGEPTSNSVSIGTLGTTESNQVTFNAMNPGETVVMGGLKYTTDVSNSAGEVAEAFSNLKLPEAPTVDGGDVTFKALKAGQVVTLNGLSFTASMDLLADQVAHAFENLTDLSTTGPMTSVGSYTGILDGTTGAVSTVAGEGAKLLNVATVVAPDTSAVPGIAGSVMPESPTVVTVNTGGAGNDEESTVTFKDLKKGQSITVAGLTVRAKADLAASDVATAFASLSDDPDDYPLADTTEIAFSGQLVGFTSGAVSGDDVAFTSIATNVNVTDIEISLDSTIESPILTGTKGKFSGILSGFSTGPSNGSTVVFKSSSNFVNVSDLTNSGTALAPAVKTVDGAGGGGVTLGGLGSFAKAGTLKVIAADPSDTTNYPDGVKSATFTLEDGQILRLFDKANNVTGLVTIADGVVTLDKTKLDRAGFSLLSGDNVTINQVDGGGAAAGLIEDEVVGLQINRQLSKLETMYASDAIINGIPIGASRLVDDQLSPQNSGNQIASAIAKAAAINSKTDATGVFATVNPTIMTGAAMSGTGSVKGTVNINGFTTPWIQTELDNSRSSRIAVVNAINFISAQTGVRAVDSLTDNKGISLVADDGRNIEIVFNTQNSDSDFSRLTGLKQGVQSGTYSLESAVETPITVTTATNGKISRAGLELADYNSQTLSTVNTKTRAEVTKVSEIKSLGIGDLKINGVAIRAASPADDTLSSVTAKTSSRVAGAIATAAAINASTELTGVTAKAIPVKVEGSVTNRDYPLVNGTYSLFINGQNVPVAMTTTQTDSQRREAVIAAIHQNAGLTGVDGEDNGAGGITLTAVDGRNVSIWFDSDEVNAGSFGLGYGTPTNTPPGVTGIAGATVESTEAYTAYASIALESTKAIKVEPGDNGFTSDGDFVNLGFSEGTFGGEVDQATSKMSPPRTGRLAFQIGANEGQKITIDLADFGKGGPITGEITWDADMDPLPPGSSVPDPVQGGPNLMGKPLTRTFISSSEAAQDVLKKLDVAMDKVNQTRATMGAVMNRLDHVVNNLTNVSMNLSGSRSQIEDADYASASTELAKTQIMQQAATAVLAQANTSQQSVLKLLQG
jgi:flagellin